MMAGVRGFRAQYCTLGKEPTEPHRQKQVSAATGDAGAPRPRKKNHPALLRHVAGERVGKDGCIKSTFHVNSQGVSGVGMVTGDEYRIIDITNQQTIDMIACDGCTAEADIVMMWKVIARNGETWTAQQVVTLKFDACTNEFTVTVKQSSVGCK